MEEQMTVAGISMGHERIMTTKLSAPKMEAPIAKPVVMSSKPPGMAEKRALRFFGVALVIGCFCLTSRSARRMIGAEAAPLHP